MDGRIRKAGVLVALLASLLSGVAVPTSAHPYHLQIANEVTVIADSVGSGQWLAQSFSVMSTFRITRLGLYISDAGASDVLGVSVRSDVSGWPSSANLTQGTVDAGSAGGWTTVDLSPWFDLVAARSYWIVAASAGVAGQGYRWWNSSGESAYPGGQGARAPDGSTWSAYGSDLAFRVYGFAQPSFSFVVSASSPTAIAGDQPVLRVDLANTGGGDAVFVWANVTLPPELSYVSDDASAVGGVRSGTYDYAFANVAPGTLSFNITTSVGGGVPNGTVATTAFTFDSTDHVGVSQTRVARSVGVTIHNAHLTLSLAPSPTSPEAGELVTFNATATNTGLEPAGAPDLVGTVDPGVVFVSSSEGTTYDPGTRTVRRTAPALAPGASASMEWTVRVATGVPGGTPVPADAWAAYRDPTGAALPNATATATAIVRPLAPQGWTIPAIVLGAVAGVLGAIFLLWRRRRSDVAVEDVFVSDSGGLLLAHRSATIVPYEDEDVLVGMFKVVQDFVRDAFSKGRDEEMRSVEFGGRTIVIERGKHHILSVVYRGTDRGELANRVRRVSREIDDTYGETIRTWTGDVDAVRGITLLLPKIWKGKPRARAKG